MATNPRTGRVDDDERIPLQEPQEDFEDSSGASGDDYVHERRAVASKPKKRRKVVRPDKEARRQSKKRKRIAQYNEQELDDMAPEDGP